MRNIVLNIASVFLLFCCGTVLEAQDSINRPNVSTQVAPAVGTGTGGAITQKPRFRSRKRRLADSLRLAAQRDSLLRVTNTSNNSVFNIGATPQAPVATAPDSTTQAAVAPVTPEVPILQKSNNPFDILRGAVTADSSNNLATQKEETTPVIPNLLEPKVYSRNFLFWIFLVSLVLLSLVVANARGALQNAYAAMTSDSALRQIYKEPIGWGSFSYLALYVLSWLSMGIFLFLLLTYYGVTFPYGKFGTFMLCFAGVSTVFIIKHTILYILANVFPITKEVRTYNFVIMTAGILLGLILMPFNIFIAYTPAGLSEWFVYGAFAAILITYLVRSLRGLTVATPFLMNNGFHFLLYLCTVEIAPLLVLAKFILLHT